MCCSSSCAAHQVNEPSFKLYQLRFMFMCCASSSCAALQVHELSIKFMHCTSAHALCFKFMLCSAYKQSKQRTKSIVCLCSKTVVQRFWDMAKNGFENWTQNWDEIPKFWDLDPILGHLPKIGTKSQFWDKIPILGWADEQGITLGFDPKFWLNQKWFWYLNSKMEFVQSVWDLN